ncbi:hypothetical protein FSP39_021028 [Pinctada imbricata]|uniref:Uncharacterized protein n=1 Tax=Pinctada imbricata TaxID=66713 RepID=A0AA88Y1E5_PINIB|nr:hypothetical protein FSP39_021028 [Pinctada imbricata]
MTATESPAPDQDLAAMEAAYEKMFDDRYSESDVEYTVTVNSPLPDPPCVHNWFTRPKRDFNSCFLNIEIEVVGEGEEEEVEVITMVTETEEEVITMVTETEEEVITMVTETGMGTMIEDRGIMTDVNKVKALIDSNTEITMVTGGGATTDIIRMVTEGVKGQYT